MLKRIVILVFILSTIFMLAMAPINVMADSVGTEKLQSTTEPPVVGVTVEVDITSSSDSAPASGLPMSTLIIFGLIAVLAVAVVIGGMALISRRQ